VHQNPNDASKTKHIDFAIGTRRNLCLLFTIYSSDLVHVVAHASTVPIFFPRHFTTTCSSVVDVSQAQEPTHNFFVKSLIIILFLPQFIIVVTRNHEEPFIFFVIISILNVTEVVTVNGEWNIWIFIEKRN
jgi:hypothetical protein